ncbi:hypothetical protein DFH09DRAFT_1421353 [Mycena vulgaris]|nr:hypothetical protein DFH09DRAFT_1421353 [Mycena vulgaris]
MTSTCGRASVTTHPRDREHRVRAAEAHHVDAYRELDGPAGQGGARGGLQQRRAPHEVIQHPQRERRPAPARKGQHARIVARAQRGPAVRPVEDQMRLAPRERALRLHCARDQSPHARGAEGLVVGACREGVCQRRWRRKGQQEAEGREEKGARVEEGEERVGESADVRVSVDAGSLERGKDENGRKENMGGSGGGGEGVRVQVNEGDKREEGAARGGRRGGCGQDTEEGRGYGISAVGGGRRGGWRSRGGVGRRERKGGRGPGHGRRQRRREERRNGDPRRRRWMCAGGHEGSEGEDERGRQRLRGVRRRREDGRCARKGRGAGGEGSERGSRVAGEGSRTRDGQGQQGRNWYEYGVEKQTGGKQKMGAALARDKKQRTRNIGHAEGEGRMEKGSSAVIVEVGKERTKDEGHAPPFPRGSEAGGVGVDYAVGGVYWDYPVALARWDDAEARLGCADSDEAGILRRWLALSLKNPAKKDSAVKMAKKYWESGRPNATIKDDEKGGITGAGSARRLGLYMYFTPK